MTGEVSQNVQGGEKNGDREDRLCEIGKLDEEVFYKKRKGGVLFDQATEFVEDVEHQPKNEEGSDDKREGNKH